jgi:hypothetical protein
VPAQVTNAAPTGRLKGMTLCRPQLTKNPARKPLRHVVLHIFSAAGRA